MSMSFPMKIEIGYFCPNCSQWFRGKPTEAWLFNADDNVPDDLHIDKDWNYTIRTDTEVLYGEKVIVCHDNPSCVTSDYEIEEFIPVVAGSLQCTECTYNVTYDDQDLTRSVLVAAGLEDYFETAWNISVTTTSWSSMDAAAKSIENHFRSEHPVQHMMMGLDEKAQLRQKLKVNDV